MTTAVAEKPTTAPTETILPDVIYLSVTCPRAWWKGEEYKPVNDPHAVALALQAAYLNGLASVTVSADHDTLKVIVGASFDSPVIRYDIIDFEADTLDAMDQKIRLVKLGTKDPGPENTEDEEDAPTELAEPPRGALHCTVGQPTLRVALQAAARIAATRTTLPILHSVVLDASTEGLIVLAADLSVGLAQRVSATVKVTGIFAAPAKLLTDFVASLPDQPVELRVTENELHVSCGRARARFKGPDPADFPPIPVAGETAWVTLEGAAFKRLVDSSAFAASKDQSQLVLGNVRLWSDAGTLAADAADGVVAVRCRSAAKSAKGEALVPASALKVAASACAEQESVSLYLTPIKNPNALIAAWDGGRVAVRLGEGQFPDLNRWVSAEFVGGTVDTLKASLLAALRQVVPFAEATAGYRGVRLQASEGALEVSAVDAEYGKSESAVSATVYGTPLAVWLHAGALIPAVAALPGDAVRIRHHEKGSVLIDSPDDDSYRAFQAPMAL